MKLGLTKDNFKKEQKKREYLFETSWDDGGKKDLQIADLLKKYNLPGTFYIIVDKVGTKGFMDWEDIKYLDQQGFEIGSHTMSHPTDLKMLHEEQLHYEIQNSKDMIETVLGHTISKFCYPRGRFDERVQAKVAEAGYLEARGTGKPGVLDNSDKLALPGTLHMFQRKEYGELDVLSYSISVIDKAKKFGGYVNVWGHSWEIDRDNLWETVEAVLSYAKN